MCENIISKSRNCSHSSQQRVWWFSILGLDKTKYKNESKRNRISHQYYGRSHLYIAWSVHYVYVVQYIDSTSRRGSIDVPSDIQKLNKYVNDNFA